MRTRVLVVLPDSSSDGREVAHRMAEQITAHVDCQVFTAHGIRNALSLLSREKPEFAIVDERLAHVDGRPVLDLIRSISPATHVTFVNTVGPATAETNAPAADSTAAGE